MRALEKLRDALDECCSDGELILSAPLVCQEFKNSPFENVLIFRTVLDARDECRHPLDHPLLRFTANGQRVADYECAKPVFYACPLCSDYIQPHLTLIELVEHYDKLHWNNRVRLRVRTKDNCANHGVVLFRCGRRHEGKGPCMSSLAAPLLHVRGYPKGNLAVQAVMLGKSVAGVNISTLPPTDAQVEGVHALVAAVKEVWSEHPDARVLAGCYSLQEERSFISRLESFDNAEGAVKRPRLVRNETPYEAPYFSAPHFHCPLASTITNESLTSLTASAVDTVNQEFSVLCETKFDCFTKKLADLEGEIPPCEGVGCGFAAVRLSDLLTHLEAGGFDAMIVEEGEFSSSNNFSDYFTAPLKFVDEVDETLIPSRISFDPIAKIFPMDLVLSRMEKYGSLIEANTYNWDQVAAEPEVTIIITLQTSQKLAVHEGKLYWDRDKIEDITRMEGLSFMMVDGVITGMAQELETS